MHARRLRRRGRHFYDCYDFIPFLLFSLFLNYVFVLDFPFVLFFFPFSFHLFSRLFYLPLSFRFETHIMTFVHNHDSMNEPHSLRERERRGVNAR